MSKTKMLMLKKNVLKRYLAMLILPIIGLNGLTAFAQTELLPAAPTSAPVLAIDAGVLPTSPFYFLDKFDEWVQKNVFTFGINSFRAQVFMESAAERISELQFLNAQGMLTNEIAQELLVDWEKDLTFSASLVGGEYLHGRRPIKLTDGVARTMLASTDAIQAEFNENAIGGNDEMVLADNFLDVAEKKIIGSLLPENAGIPDAVLRLVSDDLAIEIQGEIAKLKNYSSNKETGGIIRVGQQLLVNSVEENQKIAKEYYDKSDFQNAIESYSDCRLALRLMININLAIEPAAIIEKSEFVIKVDQAIKLLTSSGLLDGSELVIERARVLGTYSE